MALTVSIRWLILGAVLLVARDAVGDFPGRGRTNGSGPSLSEHHLGSGAQNVGILIRDAIGPAGGSATVAVGLIAGHTAVAGTENEISFSTQARIAFNSGGEPDCQVNSAIGKHGYFRFKPTGCTPGSDCTGIKAFVIGVFESTQEECDANPDQCYNRDPIPDGSTLYTCRLNLGTAGIYPLTCATPIASDPEGAAVDATCSEGAVVVVGTPAATFSVTPTRTYTLTPMSSTTPTLTSSTPIATGTPSDTPTRTPTDTPTPTSTPTHVTVFIDVASATGGPGAVLEIPTTLRSSGFGTVATLNDITFRNDLFDIDPADCLLNPAVQKELVVGRLSSDPEGNRTTLRISVQSHQNNLTISDGLLYSCRLRIKTTTLPGVYTLENTPRLAVGVDGAAHSRVAGSDGFVEVSLVGPPRPTSTSTPSVTRTATVTWTPEVAPCVGDCNGDGTVTISELVIGANIGLGLTRVDQCPALDPNGNQQVAIDEIILAVNNGLSGCLL